MTDIIIGKNLLCKKKYTGQDYCYQYEDPIRNSTMTSISESYLVFVSGMESPKIPINDRV